MTNVLRASAVTVFLSFVGLSRAQQPFPTYADNGTWSVLQCAYGIGLTCYTQTYTYDLRSSG